MSAEQKAVGPVKKALKKAFVNTVKYVPELHREQLNTRIFTLISDQRSGATTLRKKLEKAAIDGKLGNVHILQTCVSEPGLDQYGPLPSAAVPFKHRLGNPLMESSTVKVKGKDQYRFESPSYDVVINDNKLLRKLCKGSKRNVPIFIVNGALISEELSKLIFFCLIKDLRTRGASMVEAIRATMQLMWSRKLEEIVAEPFGSHLEGLNEKLDELNLEDIDANIFDGEIGFTAPNDQMATVAELDADIGSLISAMVKNHWEFIQHQIALFRTCSPRTLKHVHVFITRGDLVKDFAFKEIVIKDDKTLRQAFEDQKHILDPKQELIPSKNIHVVSSMERNWGDTTLKDGRLELKHTLDEDLINAFKALMPGA